MIREETILAKAVRGLLQAKLIRLEERTVVAAQLGKDGTMTPRKRGFGFVDARRDGAEDWTSPRRCDYAVLEAVVDRV